MGREREFAFLAMVEPRLMKNVGEALRDEFENPRASALVTRLIADSVAQWVGGRTGLVRSRDENAASYLVRLQKAECIPRAVADDFHAIRESGNEAAHSLEVTASAASRVLDLLEGIGRWVVATQGGGDPEEGQSNDGGTRDASPQMPNQKLRPAGAQGIPLFWFACVAIVLAVAMAAGLQKTRPSNSAATSPKVSAGHHPVELRSAVHEIVDAPPNGQFDWEDDASTLAGSWSRRVELVSPRAERRISFTSDNSPVAPDPTEVPWVMKVLPRDGGRPFIWNGSSAVAAGAVQFASKTKEPVRVEFWIFPN